MGVNLDELERLYKEATPGEWHWDADKVKGDPLGRERARICTLGKTITEAYYLDDSGKRDMALLCALHNVFPALLALARDGERYRWLRDPCSGAEKVVLYGRGDFGKGLASGTMLDAAIDAARKGEKP